MWGECNSWNKGSLLRGSSVCAWLFWKVPGCVGFFFFYLLDRIYCISSLQHWNKRTSWECNEVRGTISLQMKKYSNVFWVFFCLGYLSHKIFRWVPALPSCLNQDSFVCFQRTWFLVNLLEPIQVCWNTSPFSIVPDWNFSHCGGVSLIFVCISSELAFLLNPPLPGKAFVLIPTCGSQTMKFRSSELTFECLKQKQGPGYLFSFILWNHPFFLSPSHCIWDR